MKRQAYDKYGGTSISEAIYRAAGSFSDSTVELDKTWQPSEVESSALECPKTPLFRQKWLSDLFLRKFTENANFSLYTLEPLECSSEYYQLFQFVIAKHLRSDIPLSLLYSAIKLCPSYKARETTLNRPVNNHGKETFDTAMLSRCLSTIRRSHKSHPAAYPVGKKSFARQLIETDVVSEFSSDRKPSLDGCCVTIEDSCPIQRFDDSAMTLLKKYGLNRNTTYKNTPEVTGGYTSMLLLGNGSQIAIPSVESSPAHLGLVLFKDTGLLHDILEFADKIELAESTGAASQDPRIIPNLREAIRERMQGSENLLLLFLKHEETPLCDLNKLSSDATFDSDQPLPSLYGVPFIVKERRGLQASLHRPSRIIMDWLINVVNEIAAISACNTKVEPNTNTRMIHIDVQLPYYVCETN